MSGRRSIRLAAGLLLFASALGAVRPARAQSEPDRPEPLRHDLALDVALTSFSTLVWLGLELEKERLAPPACRWCGRTPQGSQRLNGWDSRVRDRLRWERQRRADVASSILVFGTMPAMSLAWLAGSAEHHGQGAAAGLDLLLVAEATATALAINQVTKLLLARERPYLFGEAASPGTPLRSRDANLSFFSGHTTLAFALAGSTGTLASLRGYEFAPWIWGTGLLSAAAVGYLRIAADKHYLTDVVVGALVGTAVGIGMPLLLHGRRGEGDADRNTASAAPLSASRAAPLLLSFGSAF